MKEMDMRKVLADLDVFRYHERAHTQLKDPKSFDFESTTLHVRFFADNINVSLLPEDTKEKIRDLLLESEHAFLVSKAANLRERGLDLVSEDF